MSLEENIKNLNHPLSDELEITTIGAGCFEGESVVLHLGNGKWAIIDSCTSLDKTCLPLFYLEKLNVNLDNVVLVACTHWHEDHIKGMSEILGRCKNAQFWYPMVGQNNNLLKYIIAGNVAQAKRGVWAEFTKCLETTQKVRNNYMHAGTMLFSDNDIMLSAISPSDKMLDLQFELLSKIDINILQSAAKINDRMLKPNLCCSALFLQSNIANVLIGADLEANRNKEKDIRSCIGSCKKRWEKGWCNVIEKSVPLGTRKFSFIKLPHHSSDTGYCEELWNIHSEQDVVGVSTVFVNNAGVKLPQKEMLAEYFSKTKEYYMTGPAPKKKEKRNKTKLSDSRIAKPVAVFSGDKGFVCSRKKKDSSWKSILLGAAITVDQQFVNNYNN